MPLINGIKFKTALKRQRSVEALKDRKFFRYILIFVSRLDARRGRNRVFCLGSCSCACGGIESPRSFSALSADLKRLRR